MRSLCQYAAACVVAFVVGSGSTLAQAQQPDLTIEKLRQDGWQVVGYVAAFENRTLILFQHKDHPFLAQCSVLIDVQRRPRLVTACYELR